MMMNLIASIALLIIVTAGSPFFNNYVKGKGLRITCSLVETCLYILCLTNIVRFIVSR